MVFVSYRREDSQLAQLIANGLRARSIESWIDVESGPGGLWEQQIERAIDRCTNVVLLLSQDTYSSEIVGREVRRGLGLGKNFVPVTAHNFAWEIADSRPDWLGEVRRFNGVPVSFDYPEAFLEKLAKHCIGEQAAKVGWWRRVVGSTAA